MNQTTRSWRVPGRCLSVIAMGLMFISPVTWAQSNPLFETPAVTPEQANTVQRLAGQAHAKASGIVALKRDTLQALKKGDAVSVELLGDTATLNVSRVTQKNGTTEWHAVAAGLGATMDMVSVNGKIAASVRVGPNLYSIQSLEGDSMAVILVDEGRFQEHSDDAPEGVLHPTPGNGDLLKKSKDTTSTTTTATVGTADDTGDAIRVIVAYTAAAAADTTNIGSTIALAVSETNQSYINSHIETNVVLAHSYQTSYTETGNIFTDLSRFENTSDGIMDEIHSRRTQYDADVAILILSDSGGYCGLASQIMADAATAFAAVRVGCATGYYSFGHEIGHLQGARHIITSDPSTTPFAYGHGYCQPGVSYGWRTIMAYSCPNGDGTRLQYWSNPFVNYGGVAMGTETQAYNARVLNETAYTVANFNVANTQWSIGYDWNCDGSYSKSTWDINPDGTFNITGSTSGGTWFESHHSMVLRFSNGTQYAGRRIDNSVSGSMRGYTGTMGCWYAHPNDSYNYDALPLAELNQETIPPEDGKDKSKDKVK